MVLDVSLDVTGISLIACDPLLSRLGIVGRPGDSRDETASRREWREIMLISLLLQVSTPISSSSTNLSLHFKKKNVTIQNISKSQPDRTVLFRTCLPEFHDQASETLAALAL